MQERQFEEEYFTNYYRKNVGLFSEEDLRKSINWFNGWLAYLNRFIDLQNGKGKRVLEVGCSIGGVSHLLYERGFEVHASDVSQYAVNKARRIAKKLKKNISFYRFDIEEGVRINGTFDIIIAFEVIEHLKNPSVAIINMKKKLKKNGILVCSTPNAMTDLSSDPTHINVKSQKEWKRIFDKISFTKVIIKQISFLPFFYKFSRYFHLVFPLAIKSTFINSPLFIIARK